MSKSKRRRARQQPVSEGPARARPPSRQRDEEQRRWLIAGGAAALVVAALLFVVFVLPRLGDGAGPTSRPSFSLAPPATTPLANPPSQPAGDGTTATIETSLGTIVIEIFDQSAPVASANFINLAQAGFYDGVVFHRVVPGFMIQGGDPEGTGRGGPGYTIADEPIVGEYTRGTVAMARTSAPNSQGSQYFIVVEDSPFLAGGGYTIFGRVTTGMEVVDAIVSGPTANDEPSGRGGTALDPVAMTRVTIQRP